MANGLSRVAVQRPAADPGHTAVTHDLHLHLHGRQPEPLPRKQLVLEVTQPGFTCASEQSVRNVCHGALGARAGVALASKLTRQSPAMVRYEPYESLAARGGWERQLGDLEQPVGLAVGGSFVAAATDSNTVHVFTSAGVHMDEMAIGGAVVAVAAQGPLLAVAWHRAAPVATGDQCMDLLVRRSADLLRLGPVCATMRVVTGIRGYRCSTFRTAVRCRGGPCRCPPKPPSRGSRSPMTRSHR